MTSPSSGPQDAPSLPICVQQVPSMPVPGRAQDIQGAQGPVTGLYDHIVLPRSGP